MNTLRLARTAFLATLLGAAASTALAETQYFEGEYVCKNVVRHNFWAVDLGAKTAQIGIRRADRVNRPSLGSGSLEIEGDKVTLIGDRNTNLYANGTLADDGSALDLIWTNKQGKVNADCTPFTLTQTNDTPTDRWDAYLTLAETAEPITDDMERSLAMARELPHADLLPALDQQAYRQKRQAANKGFRTRYQSQIPKLIAASPVETPEGREQLRAELNRMQKFKFRVDLGGLYAQHLYRNDIAPDPAFFSDEAEACQLFKANPQFFSTDHLEAFVGLPRYWWTREQASALIERTESCAAQDLKVKRVADALVKSISTRFPELDAAVNAKQFLEDEAERHAALEPGLSAIADSGSFSIDRNKRNQLRISEAYYDLFYLEQVADAQTASLEVAKTEVDTMFDGETPIDVGTSIIASSVVACDEAFGRSHYNAASPMALLHKRCHDTASSVMKQRLETKLAAMQSGDFEAKDLEKDGKFELDSGTQRAAGILGLRELLSRYQSEQKTAQNKLIEIQVAKIDAALVVATDGDSAEFDALCEQADGNRALAQACDRGAKELAEGRLQAQCDAKIAASSLAEEYRDDVIAYTSPRTGQKAEVPVRDLICLMTRGDSFDFQTSGFSVWTTTQFTLGPKGDPNALVGDLALVSEDGSKVVWEVEALDSAPKGFKDIEPAIIIGCIAEKVRC